MVDQRELKQALRLVKSGFISMKEAAALRDVTKAAIHVLIKRKRLKRVLLFGQLLLYKVEVQSFQKKTPGPRSARRQKNR